MDFSFFSSLDIWVKWFLLAIAFFFVELLHSAWVLLWFGSGALGAAIVAYFFPNAVAYQMIAFFVVSVSLIVVYFTFFKPPPPPPPPPPGVGKEVLCVEDIDNHEFKGAVKYAGRAYNARSYDDDVTINTGERVKIIEWEGNKIIVKPIPRKKDQNEVGRTKEGQ